MTTKPWEYYLIEHFLKNAKPVSKENPLSVGWCVYIEPFELD